MEDKLNSKAYQTVSQRMQAEEATCSLTMPNQVEIDEYETIIVVTRKLLTLSFFYILSDAFGDSEEKDGEPRVTVVASAPNKQGKANLMETLSEDGNINMSNVTNVVVGRVGNLFGKGIGGLSSKLGSGGWF